MKKKVKKTAANCCSNVAKERAGPRSLYAIGISVFGKTSRLNARLASLFPDFSFVAIIVIIVIIIVTIITIILWLVFRWVYSGTDKENVHYQKRDK